jgi:hypothetical protein
MGVPILVWKHELQQPERERDGEGHGKRDRKVARQIDPQCLLQVYRQEAHEERSQDEEEGTTGDGRGFPLPAARQAGRP